MKDWIKKIRSGDRRVFGRVLSRVENATPKDFPFLEELGQETGNAKVIGITGPAGVGKSTLIDQLIDHYRRAKSRVGVVAIDPTSPFSGGAVLGDRIRMQRHFSDDQVFIRSVGSRGSSGGLSSSARALVDVMDVAGCDVIFVETVGAGQSEVDVMNLAQMVLVVLGPEIGDSIQALKAGILEIADLFVLNKMDKPEIEQVHAEIKAMVSMAEEVQPVEIFLTQSVTGEGVKPLVEKINSLFCSERIIKKMEDPHRRLRVIFNILHSRMEAEWKEVLQQNSKEVEKILSAPSSNRYQQADRIHKLWKKDYS